MRRCEKRSHLIGYPEAPLDPDLVSARIKEVAKFSGSRSWDSVWSFFELEIDPQQLTKHRRFQRAYLARYARVSPFEWEGRDVSELDDMFRDVCEIIKAENAMTSSTENR